MRKLKANPHFQDIPVVMWGTGNVRAVVRSAYQAGVQFFIEKPWDINVWVHQVEQVLRRNCRQFSLAASQDQASVPV
ncbi:hypothetical protein V9K67_14515 [Paraflavisolibacter sp. H34]|uniref:hypothetical protein n=1 Tax=Huijunlia imazamoxiresistens TaxID=3127457 RepID=UPI003018B136